eukprot:4861908-Pyramimonas_sp.AAC.1
MAKWLRSNSDQQPTDGRGPADPPNDPSKPAYGATDVATVIRWLRATRFLKDFERQSNDATLAFTEIAVQCSALAGELCADAGGINVEVVRKSMARLDLPAVARDRDVRSEHGLNYGWFSTSADAPMRELAFRTT